MDPLVGMIQLSLRFGPSHICMYFRRSVRQPRISRHLDQFHNFLPIHNLLQTFTVHSFEMAHLPKKVLVEKWLDHLPDVQDMETTSLLAQPVPDVAQNARVKKKV
jgi:hypothetical protein